MNGGAANFPGDETTAASNRQFASFNGGGAANFPGDETAANNRQFSSNNAGAANFSGDNTAAANNRQFASFNGGAVKTSNDGGNFNGVALSASAGPFNGRVNQSLGGGGGTRGRFDRPSSYGDLPRGGATNNDIGYEQLWELSTTGEQN